MIYEQILKITNAMYANNDPKTGKLKFEDDPEAEDKWEDFIKPAWERMLDKKEKMEKGKGKGKKNNW